MLESLEGKVVQALSTEVIVALSPWSFKIACPHYQSLEVGQIVRLEIEMIWREQGPALFGFSHTAERQLFRHLIKIASIGPKVALALMAHPRQRVIDACAHQQIEELSCIPGVGKKTAQRLLAEIDQDLLRSSSVEGLQSSLKQELKAILENFGFAKPAIDKALTQIQSQELNVALKEALKILGGHHAAYRT